MKNLKPKAIFSWKKHNGLPLHKIPFVSDNLFNCKYEDNSLSTGYGTKYYYVTKSQMDKRKYEEDMKKNGNYIYLFSWSSTCDVIIKYIFSSNNPGFIWLDSFSHSNCEYDMFYVFFYRRELLKWEIEGDTG